MPAPRKPRPPVWDATSVRGLRRRLGLSQQALAQELGVRQQTVSEWETGLYAPRGASRRVLSLVAEQAGVYRTGPAEQAGAYRTGPGSLGRREG